MKRLGQLLLLAVWLVGAVTGGLTVQPDPSNGDGPVSVVSEGDWAGLTVQDDQIVLSVGHGNDRWRVAAPAPAYVTRWLREAAEVTPDPHPQHPLESATFIPL